MPEKIFKWEGIQGFIANDPAKLKYSELSEMGFDKEDIAKLDTLNVGQSSAHDDGFAKCKMTRVS